MTTISCRLSRNFINYNIATIIKKWALNYNRCLECSHYLGFDNLTISSLYDSTSCYLEYNREGISNLLLKSSKLLIRRERDCIFIVLWCM